MSPIREVLSCTHNEAESLLGNRRFESLVIPDRMRHKPQLPSTEQHTQSEAPRSNVSEVDTSISASAGADQHVLSFTDISAKPCYSVRYNSGRQRIALGALRSRPHL